jgi:phosphate transport system substrate-binding protein
VTQRIRLTRRRLAAVALLALVAGLVPSLRAHAAAPTGPTLPDFTNAPYQDSAPASFAYEVTSGGIQPGDVVSFSFLYNSKPGDRTHAVSFSTIAPGEVVGDIRVSTLPTSVLPAARCIGTGSQELFSAVANPFTQSVSVQLKLSSPIAAGTVLVYCFGSGTGLVGFPLAPGSGYSIAYTEPGGTVAAPYTVLASAGTEQVTVTDSGTDVTDAGLGGSHMGQYGSTYTVTLSGRPGTSYGFTAQGFDTVSYAPDHDAGTKPEISGVPGTTPTPGCSPGAGTFCTDSQGMAQGTMTITSNNPNPEYFAISGQQLSAGEPEPGLLSFTAGPSGASLPAPTPTGTQTSSSSSSSSGGPTPASTFDVGCTGNQHPLVTQHGLGSSEFFDLFSKTLMPAASTMCSRISNLMTFYGVTDELGLQSLFGNPDGPFAFVGTDRAMSSTEQAQDKPPTPPGNTISQIPVTLEPVVVTYNLNATGCSVGTLKLRSQVLSAIFTGRVTRWNDPLLTADNLGLSSCNLPILVAHDIGVTSSILKDYMSKRVPAWAPYRQPELADSWPGSAPVACTSNGSRPMALCVSGKPGMIGYGFYREIVPAGLPVAAVDNPTGFWAGAAPSDVLDGCTAAAGSGTAANPVVPAAANQDWSNASLTDTALPNSYPICTFDFVVAATSCRNPHTLISYQSLVAFLDAALSDYAQLQLPGAGFAKLPGSITSLSHSGTDGLTC